MTLGKKDSGCRARGWLLCIPTLAASAGGCQTARVHLLPIAGDNNSCRVVRIFVDDQSIVPDARRMCGSAHGGK
jgi:hypothetical protein